MGEICDDEQIFSIASGLFDTQGRTSGMSDYFHNTNFLPRQLPPWLVPDLRSDHAGETGAVWIYRGILAATRDNEVRRFARNHLATEETHLRHMEDWLHKSEQSKLLIVWKFAGFLTGFFPALVGQNALYATINSVETFVVNHYQAQINKLGDSDNFYDLRALLEQCCEDEAHHRDEAESLYLNEPGMVLKFWCKLIETGSRWAVGIARRL